jgi:2-dehydropantoate 2-reductase
VLPLLQPERIGKADVLFFLNLWSADEIARALPASSYLFGFPSLVGGGRVGQTITCTIFGSKLQGTLLGEPDGQMTPRLARLATLFKAAHLHPLPQHDILGWLQTHYVVYLGPVGEILKAGSVKNFARHPALVKASIVATREGLAVCRARGVDVKQFPEVRGYLLPLVLTVPVADLQYRSKVIQDFMEAAIGQETSELVAQYNDVLREAARLGVPTPTLSALRSYVVQHAARAA